LQDISAGSRPLFRWLWLRQPIAKIGYSIFIYDLSNDAAGLMMLNALTREPALQPCRAKPLH
jgi:hypothetical protein